MDTVFDIYDEKKTIHVTVTDEKRIGLDLIILGFNECDEYPLSEVVTELPFTTYYPNTYLMEAINSLDKNKQFFFTFYIH